MKQSWFPYLIFGIISFVTIDFTFANDVSHVNLRRSTEIKINNEECVDDPNWQWKGRGCGWVALRPRRRCTKSGDDGVLAKDACLVTCDTCPGNTETSITVDKTSYDVDETILINWSFPSGVAQSGDWIGVYPESKGTSDLPAGSELWIYCQSGSQSYTSTVPDSQGSTVFGPGGVDEGWPLT